MSHELIELANAILNDDHGINERAYKALLEVVAKEDPKAAEFIQYKVDASEGRFFFEDGDEL